MKHSMRRIQLVEANMLACSPVNDVEIVNVVEAEESLMSDGGNFRLDKRPFL